MYGLVVLNECVCVHFQVHRACVTSQGQYRRRAGKHGSLNSRSGRHKNTLKVPETGSRTPSESTMLPVCTVALNVLNGVQNFACGGGRPLINHPSQQNPKEVPLFSVSAWCSKYHQIHFAQWDVIQLYICFDLDAAQSHIKIKLACKLFPAQIICTLVCLSAFMCAHACLHMNVCAWIPLLILQHVTKPFLKSTKDKFSSPDEASSVLIVFMVIISISTLIRHGPKNLATPPFYLFIFLNLGWLWGKQI